MIRQKSLLPCLAVLCILYFFTQQVGAARLLPVVPNQDTPPEAQVELALVLTNLDQPVHLTGAGDGSDRIFIVERTGRVKVMGSGAGSPTVFLDLSAKVTGGEENGLLGLAFHPRYETNRRFYVCYTRQPDNAIVIAEYRASKPNPNVAQTNERALLVIPQPSGIHHGGMIGFGLDNFLYISTGDGHWEDPENSAQDRESLRGKMLRIDVDGSSGGKPYSIPSSNPFFGETPGRDEIYALGFRNPWRFSFDSETGQLYAGDVGHERREEINIISLGGNYGWRVFEGSLCTNFDPLMCSSLPSIRPAIEYDHSGGRCSVTAGYAYRGRKGTLPPGSYVYGDFCTGEIFLAAGAQSQLLLDTDMNITSFGEDEDGEIYVVGFDGSVHRIFIPSAQEPHITLDSIRIRNRATGEILEPVLIRQKGKKFEAVVQGSGFVPGTVIFINGRQMKTVAGSPDSSELIARLRNDTLSRPGPLVIEAVNPGGTRSNSYVIEVLAEPDR